ncbi:putative methylene tetrahydrofolate dehydrogenase [Pavlovales sp. CCMP2436]|nr:putative methylene tetrahydrofolate dehydrogenase [Pavlovales sp. CCMP2436]
MILDAAAVAERFDAEIKAAVLKGTRAKLIGLLANDDKEARMYANWTRKACERVGIAYELRECPRLDLEEAVITANEDDTVHGILIYYPVFGGQMDDYIQNIVSIKKDVEGMNYRYRYSLYHNERFVEPGKQAILPCTPLACIKIIEHAGIYERSLPTGKQLASKVVTVINRSEIVGRPLAAMLANDGALVYSVDVTGIMVYQAGKTDVQRDDALLASDVVVSGVPSAKFQVPTDCLKPGVLCINFAPGCNFDSEAVGAMGTLCPGIGKVTIAMLQRNLIRLYENYHVTA